jgi:pentatricopeptide repeat protein
LIPNFLCDSLPRFIAPSRACAREGRRHAPLRGWYVSGWLRTLAGQYDAAIEHLETSSRLSPRGYLAAPRYALGMAHFFSRHFAMLSLSVREVSFPGAYQPLASCYARMGRLEEARAVVERLRAINPNVIPGLVPYPTPEQRELFLSGLCLAMGEVA